MNKAWSKLNKTMQSRIGREATWQSGVQTLFALRDQLMETLVSFKSTLPREAFDAMPFMNAKGYHNKTIAY